MLRHRSASSWTTVVCAALVVIATTEQRAQPDSRPAITSHAEVVVFGATPGGITAAVSAASAGRKVVLLEPGNWIGGMMSGGLSNTDTGQRGAEVISGLAGEFFRRARAIEQTRGACLDPCASSFLFEPQVATQVFESMLRDAGVAVERAVHLRDVEKDGTAIARLLTSRGDVHGDVFIDASYEGDLMKLAGVSFRIGREPRRRPAGASDAVALADQEDNAGMQQRQLPLDLHLDPYRVPGDAASGPIAFVEPRPDPLPEVGDGDSRVTAYTYRLCVTDDPTNRIPFARPERYTPSDYELHARVAAAVPADVDIARNMFNPARVARSRDKNFFKYDLNSSLTLSTDLTGDGLNQGYVDQSQTRREQIQRIYRDYIQGWFYAVQTEPRLKALHARVSQFGYCADEFTDNGGWPYQFYVRVARRMMGAYVMNENDVMQNGRRPRISDPVAMGSYSFAAHHHRYLAAPVDWPNGQRKDAVMLEGLLIGRIPNDAPYPIPYRALTPRETDARNLLNPVTLSATHVAYSSIRMEPTFMMLGEAAGIAASLSVEAKSSVQNVSYQNLRRRLVDAGLRLE